MQFCHNSGGLIQTLFVLKLITSPLFSPTEKEHHICTFIPNLSKHIVGAGSLYMVVALSVERYLSISNSSQQDKVGKLSQKNQNKFWLFQGSFFGYVLPVLVFSTAFNFPKFFEFSTHYLYSNDG